MLDVLVLNADYSPIQVISWQRAVSLVLDDRVRMVCSYANRLIRSPSIAVEWPAVVSLSRYISHRISPGLSRAKLLARDGFRCQYCGVTPRSASGSPMVAELTLDHVVPRSRSVGGHVVRKGRRLPVSSWENLVTACARCNSEKGARTPEESGLRLKHEPRRPTAREAAALTFEVRSVPEEWQAFLN